MLQKQEKVGVVYRLMCIDRDKQSIIETGRKLKIRLNKHMKDAIGVKQNISGLYQHIKETEQTSRSVKQRWRQAKQKMTLRSYRIKKRRRSRRYGETFNRTFVYILNTYLILSNPV